MAKRRKKKSSLKSTLKFEIYGILIIIFAWISMAGKGALPGLGSVGRSLAHIALLFTGNLRYAIPFVFLYIGLYAMIKRDWPRKWSFRKTGILLIVLGILIQLHMDYFSQTDPSGQYTAWQIIQQPISNFGDYMARDITDQQYMDNLGGGIIGGLLYGLFFFLFDDLGAYFIKIGMFAIGFICITGWSYVDIVRRLRKSGNSFFERLAEKLEWHWAKLRRKQKSTRASRQARWMKADEDEEEELLPDEETYTPVPKPSKKPTFFQLFRQPEDEKAATDDKGQAMPIVPDDEPLENPLITATSDQPPAHAAELEPEPEPEPEEIVPKIHDFQQYYEPAVEQAPPTVEVDDAQPLQADSEAAPEAPRGVMERPEAESGDVELAMSSAPPDKPYKLPSFQLLQKPASSGKGGNLDYMGNARKLEATLESFGVRAKVVEVVRGPTVTRYELQPDIGVKVSRIVSLTDDIALALAAKDIRMEAPIPGKAAIGIEVPNSEVSLVTLREVMESAAFHESEAKLTIALGRDISGQPIVGNLAKMPHLLVAGATGSGKSVCINGIIVSILYKAKPDEVKFLMIDPKMVELNVYNGIPHLLAPVVTDPRRASLALKKVVKEMEARYEMFSKSGTRNIEGYNQHLIQEGLKPLPYIVVIVDELADLMMVAAGDVEDAICRLAQMARAAGIHLIIATQRPSVDVITGVIKANIPSRIAFGVSSQVDSRTILDSVGAEKLLGRGDMLFVPVGANKPVRVQGAFLSDGEVESVVHYVREQETAEYQPDMVPEVEEAEQPANEFVDELYDQAVQIILEAKQASVSLLQRRMRVGYTRAARLIDMMEAKGIVGPYEGSKPREVLVSMEEYQQRKLSS